MNLGCLVLPMFHAPSAFRFVKVLPGATVLSRGSFAEKCAVVGKRGVLVHPNPPILTNFLDLSITLGPSGERYEHLRCVPTEGGEY